MPITLNTTYKQIEKAIRYIDENFKEHPSVDEVAKNIGMSVFISTLLKLSS